MAASDDNSGGFTSGSDGVFADGVGDTTGDYSGWDWKKIMAAINGGAAYADTAANNAHAQKYSDPQTVQDAADTLYFTQVTLQEVGQAISDQANALAGKDAPWSGEAAKSFLTMMTKLSQQTTAMADVLSGGVTGDHNVPQQVANNAAHLWEAKAKLNDINAWYANQALQIDPSLLMDNGLVRISALPDVVDMMTNDMRQVLQTLAQHYKTTKDGVVQPTPPTNPANQPPGSGQQPPLDPTSITQPAFHDSNPLMPTSAFPQANFSPTNPNGSGSKAPSPFGSGGSPTGFPSSKLGLGPDGLPLSNNSGLGPTGFPSSKLGLGPDGLPLSSKLSTPGGPGGLSPFPDTSLGGGSKSVAPFSGQLDPAMDKALNPAGSLSPFPGMGLGTGPGALPFPGSQRPLTTPGGVTFPGSQPGLKSTATNPFPGGLGLNSPLGLPGGLGGLTGFPGGLGLGTPGGSSRSGSSGVSGFPKDLKLSSPGGLGSGSKMPGAGGLSGFPGGLGLNGPNLPLSKLETSGPHSGLNSLPTGGLGGMPGMPMMPMGGMGGGAGGKSAEGQRSDASGLLRGSSLPWNGSALHTDPSLMAGGTGAGGPGLHLPGSGLQGGLPGGGMGMPGMPMMPMGGMGGGAGGKSAEGQRSDASGLLRGSSLPWNGSGQHGDPALMSGGTGLGGPGLHLPEAGQNGVPAGGLPGMGMPMMPMGGMGGAGNQKGEGERSDASGLLNGSNEPWQLTETGPGEMGSSHGTAPDGAHLHLPGEPAAAALPPAVAEPLPGFHPQEQAPAPSEPFGYGIPGMLPYFAGAAGPAARAAEEPSEASRLVEREQAEWADWGQAMSAAAAGAASAAQGAGGWEPDVEKSSGEHAGAEQVGEEQAGAEQSAVEQSGTLPGAYAVSATVEGVHQTVAVGPAATVNVQAVSAPQGVSVVSAPPGFGVGELPAVHAEPGFGVGELPAVHGEQSFGLHEVAPLPAQQAPAADDASSWDAVAFLPLLVPNGRANANATEYSEGYGLASGGPDGPGGPGAAGTYATAGAGAGTWGEEPAEPARPAWRPSRDGSRTGPVELLCAFDEPEEKEKKPKSGGPDDENDEGVAGGKGKGKDADNQEKRRGVADLLRQEENMWGGNQQGAGIFG